MISHFYVVSNFETIDQFEIYNILFLSSFFPELHCYWLNIGFTWICIMVSSCHGNLGHISHPASWGLRCGACEWEKWFWFCRIAIRINDMAFMKTLPNNSKIYSVLNLCLKKFLAYPGKIIFIKLFNFLQTLGNNYYTHFTDKNSETSEPLIIKFSHWISSKAKLWV